MNKITIMTTGHRPKDMFTGKQGDYDMTNPIYDKIKAFYQTYLDIAKGKYDSVSCISGMALGADTLFANKVKENKMKLLAYIPFKGQHNPWNKFDQIVYNNLLLYASNVHVTKEGYVDGNNTPLVSKIMQDRNIDMVEEADVILAVYNGKKGGTANCIAYANKVGKRVIRFNPDTGIETDNYILGMEEKKAKPTIPPAPASTTDQIINKQVVTPAPAKTQPLAVKPTINNIAPAINNIAPTSTNLPAPAKCSIDIEALANKYQWKKLPTELSGKVQQTYLHELPYWAKEGKPERNLYSKTGILVCKGYRRIVIGDYGAYVEFFDDQCAEDFPTKIGQEYRTSPKYTCKYEWLCLEKDSSIKIYKQLRTVDYADYKPGMYYVSVYEVSPK